MNARSAVLLAAAALLQLTLLGRVDPVLPEPNLVLALVAGRAIVAGNGSGLRWALAGGLLLDLGGTGPLGVHALAMLSAAYVAGCCASSLGGDRLPVAALAGGAGAACYSAIVLGAADSLGLAQVAPGSAFPVAAGETVLGALLATAAAAVMARLRHEEVEAW